MNNHINHYSYHNISDFIVKIDRYSTIFAQDNFNVKSSSPLKAIYRSIFFFIKNYFFKLGFFDGYIGLVICYSGASTTFFKYIKLYEKNLTN